MTPPFDEIRDSGAARAAPEMEAQESEPLEPTVPAGEPEAPVAPAAPAEPTVEDGEAPGENGHDEEGHVENGHDEEGHVEQKLERDLDELAAKAQKADEYLELAQRTRADFENYRKRAAREAAAAHERGVAKLAKELLPAVDNLDRALEAAASASPDGAPEDNGTATLVSGIKLVHADVIAALARAGIDRFSPEGER